MFCNTISNSKRETFRQCRLKYKYNYVNRYEDTDPGNTGALHFGSFIHEVFEHSTHATAVEQLWEKANEIKDKYKFPDKYNKDIEKCFKNFLRFNASLPKESIVEHHFSEEIADGIKHEGYIDRIIKAPTCTSACVTAAEDSAPSSAHHSRSVGAINIAGPQACS